MKKPLDQTKLPGIKQAHGGSRAGAGRKKVSTKKEPTKPIRVPVSLLPEIERMIAAHQSNQDNNDQDN